MQGVLLRNNITATLLMLSQIYLHLMMYIRVLKHTWDIEANKYHVRTID